MALNNLSCSLGAEGHLSYENECPGPHREVGNRQEGATNPMSVRMSPLSPVHLLTQCKVRETSIIIIKG